MIPQTSKKHALALDFGGTKLAAGVVNIETGEISALVRKSTPAEQGAQATLQTMLAAGQEAVQRSGLESQILRVGVSFGGPISKDRTTVLHSHHVADWDGIRLTDQISQVFGIPAYMDNDANAAALGEWYFGAGKGAENMVYIQVSTGVGAGLILNGQLFRGSALAGEFGHIIVQPGGPRCACGRFGCVESLCSGWALARDGKAALREASLHSPLRELCAGDPDQISAKTVIEACRRGDAQAEAILRRAFTGLAIGIANVVSLFDPDTLVLGGGVTRAQDVLLRFLEPALQEYLHPLSKGRFVLKFSELNGMETLLGAALLA